jgi:hypothetical protein
MSPSPVQESNDSHGCPLRKIATGARSLRDLHVRKYVDQNGFINKIFLFQIY